MKQLLLLLFAVACSSPRNADPAEVSDSQRIDVERMSKAERAAKAFALVREGKTTCPRTVEECGMTSIDSARDDEGLDAPCFRRQLLHDLLVRIDRVAIPSDVLATLARSNDPDVIAAAANALDDGAVIDFLVDVEAASTPSPYAVLQGRPHEVIVDAVRRHVDAAIDELSTTDDRDLLIAAIADTAIDPGKRAGILLGADFPSSPALLAALGKAVADPHCELSARAASALAKLGDPTHLPRGPEQLDVKTFLHEACRLVGADPWDESSSLVATFVPKSGLVVTAPRGVEFADTQEPLRTTYHATEDGEASDIYLLLRTLGRASCDAKQCVGETARYELGWSRGKLARVTILRDLAKEKLAIDHAPAPECGPLGD
jgi:hypothetical protein